MERQQQHKSSSGGRDQQRHNGHHRDSKHGSSRHHSSGSAKHHHHGTASRHHHAAAQPAPAAATASAPSVSLAEEAMAALQARQAEAAAADAELSRLVSELTVAQQRLQQLCSTLPSSASSTTTTSADDAEQAAHLHQPLWRLLDAPAAIGSSEGGAAPAQQLRSLAQLAQLVASRPLDGASLRVAPAAAGGEGDGVLVTEALTGARGGAALLEAAQACAALQLRLAGQQHAHACVLSQVRGRRRRVGGRCAAGQGSVCQLTSAPLALRKV